MSSASLMTNLYRACHGKTDMPLKIQKEIRPKKDINSNRQLGIITCAQMLLFNKLLKILAMFGFLEVGYFFRLKPF